MTDALDDSIMKFVGDNPDCTTRQICMALGVDPRGRGSQKIRRHAASLARWGYLVMRIDEDKWDTRHFTLEAVE